MRKLSVILKNNECPFGLKVPDSCGHVGECIKHMAPMEVLGDDADKDEIISLVKANRKLLLLQGDGQRCPYAGNIIEEKDAVECNFDSVAPGEQAYNFEPSKFYSKVYDNISYDGLYSYPMGWYGDNNISRNLYYSLWSITSAEYNLIKTAAENDIEEAIQHAIMQEDLSFTGKACYKIIKETEMSLKEILQWDDYSGWGGFDPGELSELSKEDVIKELNQFRPGFGDTVKTWTKIPPIILVDTLEAGKMIGDGRGRVSFAVGVGIRKLPVIILKEDLAGDICFEFVNGIITHK
jgi:hypothetical protein